MFNFFKIITCLIFLLGCSNTKSDIDKMTPYEIAEYHLEVVSHFATSEKISKEFENINYARSIYFWEEISGLESEISAGYHGRMPPTENDYKKWSEWYQSNKEKIIRDTAVHNLIWEFEDYWDEIE